ncbi:glycosyltransferase family 2 protein [Ramlibacter henchirensis]|uniref:Glycosyltransferase family 2 protein n=1 Tax=Ramlibacter henchirensis TaxID=204072 RepID=A0A4Z0BQT6_9BURK|nr:glycosyltransferase family 2 protein [Ramlibacter henchirensis]TFZ00395.1 glycosyltransferase family 2 protein [Ramlibacter henchirensis]
MFDPVVVIPVFNHPATIGGMVAQVRAHGLRCILVDDGSDRECAGVLDALARQDDAIALVRLPRNRGKGAAMVAGFREAGRRGHSHVLQIDADGQHACADIPRFLAQARAHPKAVIAGCPLYDASVPRGRLLGRYATHVWVWINTLSFDIRDSMCGFRVYPLASLLPLLDAVKIGRRMEFDSDVIVRLHWRGVPVVNQPTRVTYPQDGVSHFRMWRDNVRISAMHARLFAGMLCRAPLLLWRKVAA